MIAVSVNVPIYGDYDRKKNELIVTFFQPSNE
jgi:hypothetical protein